jgi:hypothetical protein
MNLADRIEKRRFVGREFLLWLWFEAELFEATLATAKTGSFGMWIEGQLVLSLGKETTRIKGSYPTSAREAKEGLLVGKLPEIAGIHLSWREQEFQFVLHAERMALSGLKLPTVLGQEEAEPAVEPRPPVRRKRAAQPEEVDDEQHEAFYERMNLTREVEGLLEALYADFLALRLSPVWGAEVLPMMRAWARGSGEVNVERYRTIRQERSSRKGKRPVETKKQRATQTLERARSAGSR